MEKENVEYRMRSLNSQINFLFNYINTKILEEKNQIFHFMDKIQSNNVMEIYFASQLELNIEMLFVKLAVFLEYLQQVKQTNNYLVNKKLLFAGLRAYVAHKGTQKDFEFSLPFDSVLATQKVEIKNNDIIFTILTGDYTTRIDEAKIYTVNLTQELIKPHLSFIENNYPNWNKLI